MLSFVSLLTKWSWYKNDIKQIKYFERRFTQTYYCATINIQIFYLLLYSTQWVSNLGLPSHWIYDPCRSGFLMTNSQPYNHNVLLHEFPNMFVCNPSKNGDCCYWFKKKNECVIGKLLEHGLDRNLMLVIWSSLSNKF